MNLHDNGPAWEIDVKRANVARVYDYLLGGYFRQAHTN